MNCKLTTAHRPTNLHLIMKGKKVIKGNTKKLRKFKKKKSYGNLPDNVKNLPPDIQMIIFMMVISASNSDNFRYHKSKFTNSLNYFNLNFNNELNIKKNDGVWFNYTDYIHYNFRNNICQKLVKKDQQKLLQIKLSDHEILFADNKQLPEHRNYANTATFWFHEKCRCKCCDKIKMYAIKNKNYIYQYSEEIEYSYKADKTRISTTSGFYVYDFERTDVYPKFKQLVKNKKFNSSDNWRSQKTFLERLEYIFNQDNFL